MSVYVSPTAEKVTSREAEVKKTEASLWNGKTIKVLLGALVSANLIVTIAKLFLRQYQFAAYAGFTTVTILYGSFLIYSLAKKCHQSNDKLDAISLKYLELEEVHDELKVEYKRVGDLNVDLIAGAYENMFPESTDSEE